MDCSIKYENNEELSILTKTFKGNVEITDILESWKHIVETRMLTQNHRAVISDYRECNMRVEIEDLPEIKKTLHENINLFENLKFAVIIDSQKIVLPMLYKINHPVLNIEYFSTLEAANNWVRES